MKNCCVTVYQYIFRIIIIIIIISGSNLINSSALESLPINRSSSRTSHGGATPKQAKWIKLDLNESITTQGVHSAEHNPKG